MHLSVYKIKKSVQQRCRAAINRLTGNYLPKYKENKLMIKSFTLEHFRCFQGTHSVNFAIPDGVTAGSGLTYLIGKNNAGKTSILEAMQCRADDSRYAQIRSSDIKSGGTNFIYVDDTHTVLQSLTQVRPESYSLKNSIEGEKHDLFLRHFPVFVPSRRYWSSRIGNPQPNLNLIRQQAPESKMRQGSEGYYPGNISDSLYCIETDANLYDGFIERMRAVFPDFVSFSILNEEYPEISYTTAEGITHKTDFLGDGVVSVMRIIATIMIHGDRLIVIDEAELSLHQDAQKRLLKVLADFAKKTQILLSTHSAYMISWELFKNGAKINKVSKYPTEGSNVYTLDDYSAYKPLLKGASWNQPYLMDVVAKDIFFCDSILFTEGQEDVGLLRQEGCLKDDINIFGYGVRGFPNFRFALKLAKDLGIRKAGVLIDKGDEEDREIADFLSDYSPDYLIVQWDRDDIRDKSAYYEVDGDGKPGKLHSEKTGYFTIKGKFKTKDPGDFFEKIKKINEYFSE